MKIQKNDIRVERLRKLYQESGHTALILTRAANLYWLLGGRVQVGIAGDYGICRVVVNDERVVILTNNIEAQRLRDEEVGEVPEILAFPWADEVESAAAERELSGENPLLDTACEASLRNIRTVLLPEQIREAEEVAGLCGEAVTQTAMQIKPGMTEFEISGILSREAISRGLVPNVLFTPTDSHISAYRHALSGSKKMEKLVMLSLGANYNGLYASITRFLSFGQPDAVTMRAQEMACSVAARIYTETTVGKTWSELYKELGCAYEDLGIAEEFKLHHQGGLGGFQVRELRLMPSSDGKVQANQLYAWNPSCTGFKSEDMLLVGEHENRLLTITPEFPHRAYSYGGKTWNLAQIMIR
ncbi:M24 family metallopeptidase [Lawsonibacter sp. LCP25S3_G6]|uniref:M24 family metallopeptidase n=1 Tax=unclassified Lawsonibacter TaxID=2617946 RepID=UPI003F9A91CA